MGGSEGKWLRDPTDRHAGRWHDGEEWTQWVSDGGEPFEDHADRGGGDGATAATPEGWFADPAGRHQGRFRGTDGWSDWVSDGGDPFHDPAGAPPTSAAPRPNAGGLSPQGAVAGFWSWLGGVDPDVVCRPEPNVGSAFGGTGGVVIGVGIITMWNSDSVSRGPTIAAGLILIALGLAARLLNGAPTAVRAAGTGAGAVGIAAVTFAIGSLMIEDATNPRVAAIPLLLGAAAYLGAWVAPGFRGRPVMIGLAALLALLAGAVLVGGTSAVALSTVSLLAAAGLLAFVFVADQRGFTGIGTTAVVTALVATALGLSVAIVEASGSTALGVYDQNCYYYGECGPSMGPLAWTGVLTFGVGLVVCLVGSRGKRRATTWYGAATSAVGLLTFFGAAVTPDSAAAAGATLLVSGAILVGIGLLVRQLRPNAGLAAAGPVSRDSGQPDR